jgi:hypothetical protein
VHDTKDNQPKRLQNKLFGLTPAGQDEEEDIGSCASRPSPKWLPAFHVKTGRTGVRSFDYVHMGLKQFDPSGTSFRIEFHEPEPWRLVVHGRSLWKIYNYLVLHRLEWIEKADRDFEDGKQPIISSIEIESIQDAETSRD